MRGHSDRLKACLGVARQQRQGFPGVVAVGAVDAAGRSEYLQDHAQIVVAFAAGAFIPIVKAPLSMFGNGSRKIQLVIRPDTCQLLTVQHLQDELLFRSEVVHQHAGASAQLGGEFAQRGIDDADARENLACCGQQLFTFCAVDGPGHRLTVTLASYNSVEVPSPGKSDSFQRSTPHKPNSPIEHVTKRVRTVTPPWVIGAWALAVLALLVQHWLVPFSAGSHLGLFTNGGDLDVYRHGGLQVLHGGPLYDTPIPPGAWFTYPPFAALGFIPLSLLAFPVAHAVWMFISFLALTATIWRCATVLGYRAGWQLGLLSVAMAVLALNIEAVRGTLWQGQINLVLMAIIVWDLTRSRGARLRGWTVGIAAGIKLTAIVFVPYLVITRQWRAAVNATATAAVTVLVTWCLLPSDSAQYWFHTLFQTSRIGPLTHPGNFSIGGIVATMWDPASMPTVWWLFGVAAAALIGYYAAYRADLNAHSLLAITIVGLLSCTVPPLAWSHHWVWTVPLLAVAIDRVVRSTGSPRARWIAATAALCLIVFMWLTAWLYNTALQVGGEYPTYIQAFDAAIKHMSRADKLLAVGVHPMLFIIVALATIGATTSTQAKRQSQRLQMCATVRR